MSSDSSREQGIGFGDLDEKLLSVDYPVHVDAIREEYGDHELDLPEGSTTLGDALAELEGERFESVDGVKTAVKNVVGSDAVGREGYTDRGGIEPDGPVDESF